MEESVVYQHIFKEGQRDDLQKGEQRGLRKGERHGLQTGLQQGLQKGVQQGIRQEARKVALELSEYKFGKLAPTLRAQIERLAAEQSESLRKALFELQSKAELARWLR